MIISFVIPVFNNEDTIQNLVTELTKICLKLNQNYEVIFVNDGSTDKSLKIIKDILKKNKKIKLINLSKNFGQGTAIYAGLQYVRGDYLVQMDADLQDPPSFLKKMYHELINNKNDLVIAARSKTSENLYRKFFSFLFHKIIRVTLKDYPEKGFNFWMCNKKFYKNLLKIVSPTASIQSDVLKIGFKKKIIFYERKKRKSESQNSFFKLLNSFLEFYFNSSYWLVRLFMFAGIFSFILSIIYIFTILYAYLNNSTPFIGWSPIIILILIFGSLNLIFTGIVGEYLINFIKIYNKKETAFIDYTVNFKSKK